jgi:outer membrane protein assembly factor BamB
MLHVARSKLLVGVVALALSVALGGCENPFGASDDRGILWEVYAQGAKTTPLILESLLVFGTLDGTAIAFDRESGDVRWKTPLGPGSVVGGTVEEAAGLAIIPKYAVWALDPKNGAVRWTFDGPDGAAGTHDLATSGDTVFTASAFGWASAVNARIGQAIWNVDLLESPFRPTVTEDLVIYGTRRFLGGTAEAPWARAT